MTTAVAQVIAALVGAVAGIGIMGTADHFTRDRSLWPAPICPQCGSRARAVVWIPVVGTLTARRQCPTCGTASSWRLALAVQIIAGALAVLLLGQYGVSLMLGSAAVETAVLLAVAVIDFQHRLIPTLLVYPTIVFAIACSAFWPNLGLLNSLLGGGLAFVLFFSLALIARLIFGEGALGDGDVTLATLVGVICGYPMVVLSLALGALAGGLGALVLVLIRRSPFGTTIPYGPYLVIGVLYVLLSGNTTHPLYSAI